MRFDNWLDGNDGWNGVVFLAITIMLCIFGFWLTFINASTRITVDPCQPSRQIHYECMPGGQLNPTKALHE